MIAVLAALSAWAKPPHNLSHQPEPLPSDGVEPTEAVEAEVAPAEPAPAPPAAEPLYDALLGGAGPDAPVVASASLPDLPTAAGAWPLLVALVGAGAVWVATRKRFAGRSELLTVVGRTGLGAGNAGLIVVDVKDGTGRTRRLLVGTGGSGAPTLVADLGEDEADIEVAEVAPVRSRPMSLYAAASPAAEVAPFKAGARQKAQAMELIGEIVQARRTADHR